MSDNKHAQQGVFLFQCETCGVIHEVRIHNEVSIEEVREADPEPIKGVVEFPDWAP